MPDLVKLSFVMLGMLAGFWAWESALISLKRRRK